MDFSDHIAHNSKKMLYLLKKKLWARVLFGLFLGILCGILFGPDLALISSGTVETITNWLALPGNLFLRLIKMIIIPLIFSSIAIGILTNGRPEFLKKIGPRLALYFVITTIIATIIGFLVALVIHPGTYIDATQIPSHEGVVSGVQEFEFGVNDIPNRIVDLLPSNPFEAMINGDMLGIVIFTILFGIALLFVKRRNFRTIYSVLETIQGATLTIVKWAMLLAPYAVFGLMTQITSQIGVQVFFGLGMYVLTVFAGLLLILLVYMVIIWLFTQQKVGSFLKIIFPVQLLAFSTSSSAAAMPLSMQTAEKGLKIKPAISRFLIPIGATINMDGTALYQVVATAFLAQVFGVELSLLSMAFIIAITVGASIGAPAAPGVGIVILATILESVGIPGAGIALILGVDRLLDMSRTSINVTGDLTACLFFNKWLGRYFSSK